MSLKAQVEAYAGSVSDTGTLSQWLTDSARILADMLPVSALGQYSTIEVVDGDDGFDVSTSRVLEASQNGRKCQPIDPAEAGKYNDQNSMFYATPLSPVCYVTAGSIIVLPKADGVVYLFEYPAVTGTDETIATYPPTLIPVVVLRTAMLFVLKAIQDTYGTIASLGMPVAPIAPTLTPVSYADATASGITPDAVNVPVAFVGTLDVTPQLTQLASALDADQDIELAQAKLAEIQSRVGKFVQEQNQQLEATKAGIQSAMQQVELSERKAEATAKMTTDVEVQNKVQRVQAALANNKLLLEQYSTEMQGYTAQVGSELQRYQVSVSVVGEQTKIQALRLAQLRGEYTQLLQTVLGVNANPQKGE